MENIHHAVSRYGHGEICPECGQREAFYGDFIGKYETDHLSMFWPAEKIKRKDML